MSRITRRTFLRSCTLLTSNITLAACTWNNPTIAGSIGQDQLTLWSTPGSIDQALARWRRINPGINVRRLVFDASTLADELTQLPKRTTDIPDIIVADSYTIVNQRDLGMWRHVDASTNGAGLLPAALSHTLIDAQRLIGVPLTCNPLKVWYQSELLSDILGIREVPQVQMAMGNSLDSFEAFIRQIYRGNPMVATVASCFDDVCYPLAIDAMQQQRPVISAFDYGLRLAQQQIIGRAVHFGGAWFDLLKRNNVAMLVGGRGLGQVIARTWNNEIRSPWQTMTHPLGSLYGPNLVAAIPIQAFNYERATQLVYEFAHDAELQTIISNESSSVPALISAYERPELQEVDTILPQRTIRDTWMSQETDNQPMPSRQHVMQLQRSKDVFYAWQQARITDEEIRTLLANISSMTS